MAEWVVKLGADEYRPRFTIPVLRKLCRKHGPISKWDFLDLNLLCDAIAEGIAEQRMPRSTTADWVAANLEPGAPFEQYKAAQHELNVAVMGEAEADAAEGQPPGEAKAGETPAGSTPTSG